MLSSAGLLTVRVAAECLGLTTAHVYNLIAAGRLREAPRVRPVMVTAESVVALKAHRDAHPTRRGRPVQDVRELLQETQVR